MKIGKIMRTNTGSNRLPDSLPGELEITPELLERVNPSVLYEVRDSAGEKIGEISGEKVCFLARSIQVLDLDDIVNQMEDGVVVVDKDGRICYANNSYTRIIGVPMRKTIGKSMYDIEPEALLLKALEQGKPMSRERQLIKSVGKYVAMHITPIIKNGAVAGAYSIFRDVTELNQLNQEVKRVAGVAEELSNQLNALTIDNKIVSNDRNMKEVVTRALMAAHSDAAVLIRGENGVGKEVIAKLIHKNSPRCDKPMITVNCAAIPENLIESELFGYEEGSFTGAKKGGKAGKFEIAQGGTLFLDEIGDMPLAMQSKLLRVLQEGEIEKLGRDKNIPVDVRIIAATNQPLEELIDKRLFRQDLFYRINVIMLFIPPLRERTEDIVSLASLFLAQFNEKYQKTAVFSPEAYEVLLQYQWPGNIRQLRNCIESAVIMHTGQTLDFSFLPAAGAKNPRQVVQSKVYRPLKEEVEQFERKVVGDVLEQCGGDREEAIRRLGISRRTFYRKMR